MDQLLEQVTPQVWPVPGTAGWSGTALGEIDNWSHSLRTAVQLLMDAPLPMFLIWGDLCTLVYNAQFAAVAGGRHPQAFGGPVAIVWPELWRWDHDVFQTECKNAIVSFMDQQLVEGEDSQWFDMFYTPLRDDDGQVRGVLCNVIDNTRRVQAESVSEVRATTLQRLMQTVDAERKVSSALTSRLRAESRSLKNLFEQAPGFMALTHGPQHVFDFANASYMRLVGQRDLIGKPVALALPEVVSQGFLALLDSVFRSGQPYVGKNIEVILQKGIDQPPELHMLDFVYQPVIGNDGIVSGIFVEGVDVTERAAAEERLRIAHEAGGIGTFEWFPITDRMITSTTYRALWGFEPETELDVGMLVALVDPEDHDLLATATKDNRENPLAYAEFRIRRADTGERRWLARRGQVIGDGITTDRRYVGVAFDITERKLVEEALASTEHQLRILNETLEHRVIEEIDRRARAEEALHQSQKMEAIGQLTGGVAHDFNNVLQIIGGNLQLLQNHVADDPLALKRLDIATAAVMRGAKLSSQLLAFARRQPLQPTVINLGRLVSNMHDLLRRALGESIQVEVIIADDLWNTLADQSQIENVILNLVINSRDAMDGRGCVSITLDNVMLNDTFAAGGEVIPAGDYVVLAVSDDGAGMAPDILQKAFEPFFTTKPEGEGTGLGLSMAYGFVKQSHGHIRIYSKPEQGTTIRIYLPRSLDVETRVQLTPAGSVEGGVETILVVEDDPGVQTTVVDTLTMLGYRVLKADNGISAMALLKSGVSVDLLFTDVVMPGALRSPDLARQARSLLPDLAVLFTSGYTQDAIVHGGRLDPGVDLLSKPYSRDQLAQKIRASLAKAQMDRMPAPTSAVMPAAVDATPGPRSLHILVVEDNPDLCQLVCELLHAFGHVPTPAGSAEEALTCISGNVVDVLLTDVRLPGMSGIDLARQMLLTKPLMRVIFASGYGAAVTANVGFPASSLAKPYDIEQLQALLESFD